VQHELFARSFIGTSHTAQSRFSMEFHPVERWSNETAPMSARQKEQSRDFFASPVGLEPTIYALFPAWG